MDTPISVKLPNISINSGKPLIEKTACLLDIDFFQVLILVYSQGPEADWFCSHWTSGGCSQEAG
jgi:hypothetical protein